MKTTFKTHKLLAHLKSFVPKNSTLPILEAVRFRIIEGPAIEFTTNDLESVLISSTPCSTDMPIGTDWGLNHASLKTYLGASKQNQITIELGSTKQTVPGEDGKEDKVIDVFSANIDNCYNLTTYPTAEEFPNMPNFEAKITKVFSPALYHEFKAAYAFCGTDDLRPVMSGVCVTNKHDGQYQMCATNAHMLYKVVFGARPKEDTEDFEMIISNHKLVVTTAQHFKTDTQNVVLSWNDQHVVFHTPEFMIMTRLIDGIYPKYNAVIPMPPKKEKKAKEGEEEVPNPFFDLTVNKSELVAAINKVKVASSNFTKQVHLLIKGNVLSVSASDEENGTSMSADIVCSTSVDKTDFQIAFNSKFLLVCIANVLGSDVVFTLSEPNRASVIKSGHRLILTMPMMLNN